MPDPIRCHIAGVKFREGAGARLLAMSPGMPLTLDAEPGNKYDPNAVQVLHDGFQIGYVPAFLSAKVTRLLAAGAIDGAVYEGEKAIAITYHEDDTAEPV